MTHPEGLDLLRHALATRDQPGVATSACLDDDTIAALAEGTLDGAARATALAHVAACAHCRGAVASVARALADAGVAREVAALDGTRRRRWYRIALPAAAAAVLLLLSWPPVTDDAGSRHRAPLSAGEAVPVPVSPIGTVAKAEALVWRAVSGTDRYRVTLFDAAGQAAYETQLADTVAQIPDSVLLVPGRSYLWKVAARTGWDRWAESELVEFSLARSPPP